MAVGAYLHCEHEPGDASLMALAATLRKRLSQARESVPPYVHELQVHKGPCQCRTWARAHRAAGLHPKSCWS